MSFKTDLEFSKNMLLRLKLYFKNNSFEGRYVITENKLVQEIIGADVILQKDEFEEKYLEVKCVRKVSNTIFIETKSCTVEGHEKSGWIYTSKADILLYCMYDDIKNILYCYEINFKKLKKYYKDTIGLYSVVKTKQLNKTECVLIPLDVIKYHIGYKNFEN